MQVPLPRHFIPRASEYYPKHLVPSSPFFCVAFRKMLLLAAGSFLPSSWRISPCRLFMTDYSMYSQLPSMSSAVLQLFTCTETGCRT
jgi:hypothetical protein